MKITEQKLKEFIEALRSMELYTPLRAQGIMTSNQVSEACDIVDMKIELTILAHFGKDY